MKKSIAVVLLVIVGCAHNTPQVRVPASTTSANLEGLDPQFEKPWNGSLEAENKTLRDLGQTISNFVAEQGKVHQAWKNEYELLRQNPRRSKSQERRFSQLSLIISDLPDSSVATRDVHRRPQACLAGTLNVDSNLAKENQKGIFVPGAQYDAIVRFSNGNPRNLPDVAPDARGMAVKVLPERTLPLDTSINAKTLLETTPASELNQKGLLDFLAINFPVFFVNDPDKYVKINQAFLKATDDPVAAANPKSLSYKYYEAVAVYFAGLTTWEKELTLNVNGSIILNPLHEQYWSMMSYRLGAENDPERTAIKYTWVPCQQNLPKEGKPEWTNNHDYASMLAQLKSFAGLPIPPEVGRKLTRPENRYYLRENLRSELMTKVEVPNEAKKCFALKIQRYIDEENTPVEDTTQIWLENESQRKFWAQKFAKHGGVSGHNNPRYRYERISHRQIAEPITIATLQVEPISGDRTGNSTVCENLSFDPWNNVPSSHKPLGIVGRMRKSAYAGSKHTRHEMNNVSEAN